jgi:hypothetical protein
MSGNGGTVLITSVISMGVVVYNIVSRAPAAPEPQAAVLHTASLAGTHQALRELEWWWWVACAAASISRGEEVAVTCLQHPAEHPEGVGGGSKEGCVDKVMCMSQRSVRPRHSLAGVCWWWMPGQ